MSLTIGNRLTLFTSSNHLTAFVSAIHYSRNISTTASVSGKRNFRQIFIANKRGTRVYKERRSKDPDSYPDIPIYTDVRPIGYQFGKSFRIVPELIPELIVPDLTNCQLKPYVSYRANDDVVEEEFTAKSLFKFVYGDKIKQDLDNGRLDGAGQPLELSEEEKLSIEDAYLKARKCGSDIFSERIPEHWECLKTKLG